MTEGPLAGRRPLETTGEWHRPRLVVVVVLAVAGFLGTAAFCLPRESAPLPAIARHALEIALPKWGTTEVVSEIVYGSRGFDTFGETFLLLAAVVGVVVLTRTREARSEYVGESAAGRREQQQAQPSAADAGGSDADGSDANGSDANGGHAVGEEREAREAEKDEEDEPAPDADPDADELGTPAPERVAGMSVVVRVAGRAAAPILAVAAVYLAALGYTPGGGFPAGAALAGVALLLYAALGFNRVRAAVRPSVLEPVEMLGAAAIVGVGLVGIGLRGSMFANWLPLAQQQTIRAGGTLQLFSGAELVEVATGLTIAIFALLGMEHDWAQDGDDNNSADASGADDRDSSRG